MFRYAVVFALGLVMGGASISIAASGGSADRKITLRDGDEILMPDLRWNCFYLTRAPSPFSNAPPGPRFGCGRLAAWTGGIRTETDLYYVVVRRGTNANPRIMFSGRRP